MSKSTSFRAVEQRTIQLMGFEDGLWDLLLGMIFLALSCYPLTRALLGPVWNLGLFLAVLAVLVVGQLLLRRIVSEPRLGRARTRRSPKLRLLLVFTVVMFVLTLGLVLWTLLNPSGRAGEATPVAAGERGYLVELIVIIVMGGIFSGLGYITGVSRLYIYGWLLGLANLASIYIEHEAGWTFMLPSAIAAGIILLIGTLRFLRFINKYPDRAEAG